MKVTLDEAEKKLWFKKSTLPDMAPQVAGLQAGPNPHHHLRSMKKAGSLMSFFFMIGQFFHDELKNEIWT